MKREIVDDRRKAWAIEFAYMLGVDDRPEYSEIISLTAFTMIYRIADEFQDGKFRDEILARFIK